MNLKLHIDRLVLERDSPGSREELEAAIALELSRAISAAGAPQMLRTSTAAPVLLGGEVRADGATATLGARIGQAINGCFRKM